MKTQYKTLSFRQNKIAEQLRQLISNFLLKEDFYNDYLESKSVSITDVDVSPDLKNAKIFVVPFKEKNEIQMVNSLNKKSKYIKTRISKSLKTKYVPNIKFYLDTTREYSSKIDSILNKIN